MTNKELNALIALKMNLPKAEIKKLQEAFTNSLRSCLKEHNVVDLENFGKFEVTKISEQEIILPESNEKKITPPQLFIEFVQSSILQEKLNLKTKR